MIEDPKSEKADCLLCHEKVTPKTYNLQRHKETKHKDFFNKHQTEEARKEVFKVKLSQIEEMRQGIKRHLNRSEIITKSSFKIAEIILKKQKPFSDGEMVKECIIAAMGEILDYHKDKNKLMSEIRQIQLSKQTIVRRAETISAEIKKLTLKKLDSSLAMSICLDESTDRNDISQLVVFAKIVSCNEEIINQPLGLIPLLTTTTSEVMI